MNALQESNIRKREKEMEKRLISPPEQKEIKHLSDDERKQLQRKYRLTSMATKKLLKGEIPTAEEMSALQESEAKKREREMAKNMSPASTSPRSTSPRSLSPRSMSPNKTFL
jgi:hypothetical protein